MKNMKITLKLDEAVTLPTYEHFIDTLRDEVVIEHNEAFTEITLTSKVDAEDVEGMKRNRTGIAQAVDYLEEDLFPVFINDYIVEFFDLEA